MSFSRRRTFGIVSALTFVIGGTVVASMGTAQSGAAVLVADRMQGSSVSAAQEPQKGDVEKVAPAQVERKPIRDVPPTPPQDGKGRGMKGDRQRDKVREAPVQAPPPATSPGTNPPADPKLMRNIAKQMVTMERTHRERQARMDRLVEVFSEAKQMDKLKEIEALRTKENTRYQAAMEGYKKLIGPEIYGKIFALMNGAPAGAGGAAGATRGGGR